MEPARLAASSKQQAASKQPAPQGPGRAPAQGSRNGKKNVTTLSGMGFRNFLGDDLCCGRTPTGRKRQFSGVLARSGPRALSQNRRPGQKTPKSQFAGVRGTFGENILPPQNFLPESAQLFTFYVLADRTPTGGKSQNTGVSGHFGLGRRVALREIPGGKHKTALVPKWGDFEWPT